MVLPTGTTGWSDYPGRSPVYFEFDLVNDGASRIETIDGVDAWFDGGTPIRFAVTRPTNLNGAAKSGDGCSAGFIEAYTGGPNVGASGVLITANTGFLNNYPGAARMTPFGAGTLHWVMEGTFEGGRRWEVRLDVPPAP